MGLPGVTKGYKGLQGVTLGVTRGYGGYKGLKGVTRGFNWLQWVTRG